ncbi:MAG: hypothetical protein DRP11_03360 [Candidatus Aenigmatarchaeota archaeon]|nr:MAG: hypothetical protein DRP11_03360 [Candidatus Aenigmarchaeota archaeon]
MKRLFTILLILVLIGGCTQNQIPIFEEEKKIPEIIVIENLKVSPSPPIQASTPDFDSEFSISFNIVNKDQEKEVDSLNVYAYDWGRCIPVDVATEGVPYRMNKMFPGETKSIEWKFKAPTNEELGKVPRTCPIKFLVKYSYRAVALHDAVVAKDPESHQVSPNFSPANGPISIDIDFGSEQPFKSGTRVPFNVVFRNTGEGDIKEVPAGNIEISVEGLGGWDMNTKCRFPGGTLPFIKKKTPPILCYFDAPPVDLLKTYTVRVALTYDYTIYGEMDVRVEPIYEGLEEMETTGAGGGEGGGESEGAICGDGTCDTGENSNNCCQDCGCPAGYTCKHTDAGYYCELATYCGDGVCSSGEDSSNCCIDCGCDDVGAGYICDEDINQCIPSGLR